MADLVDVRHAKEGIALLELSKNSTFKETLTMKPPERTEQQGGFAITWDTNVNLDAPDANNPFTQHDVDIQEYYNALQFSLFEHNFPETVDRTYKPRRTPPSSGVSIVMLGSPQDCFGTLLEGGRQCPGDMLLVLSPSWLIKDKTSDNTEGVYSLYVKKAITFDRGGSTYIDEFETPRRCTYFVNFFTNARTDGQRNDGEDLELDLDCPMSNSTELCKRVDNKLLTRLWMAEAGVAFPETLAIVYQPVLSCHVQTREHITVVTADEKDDINDKILKELRVFLNLEGVRSSGRVVLKSSGPSCHGNKGASLHDVADFDQIYNAIQNIWESIEPDSAVLVESFHQLPKNEDAILDDYSFRVSVCVCRQVDDDTAIATQMVGGVGKKNAPFNGETQGKNAIPVSLETTLDTFGVNEKDQQRLYNTMKQGSERIMSKVIEDEKNLTSDKKGGPGAQTDVIGVEYVLTATEEGHLEPVCIDVISHGCVVTCQLFESLNPHKMGETVRPLVTYMIKRSQMFVMKGKRVLVVGAGGWSKRFIFDSFQDYGIEVVLVDPDETSYGASKASTFIHFDFLDHKRDEEHAENIITILQKQNTVIHGCITFWEDCGPLAAAICTKLNLRGPGENGACIAKKKSLTQNSLAAKTLNNPHFPRACLYSGKSTPISSESDIDRALQYVGLPAVLKLEYGSSAVGVKPVKTRVECINVYNQLRSHLKCENDHPGVGLGHGNDMLLMEQLIGTEHDVDVIIFNRQLVAAFISDNGPTKKGSFTETTGSMPSSLANDRQGMLITAAFQCCTEIGLVDGVFNVEMMMTASGPKLIEINARMGGFYLRDWILSCYRVDLLLASFMICLGIRPIIPRSVPTCHLMGTMCVPSLHKKQLEDKKTIKLLNIFIQNGTIKYTQMEPSLDDCGDDGSEEPYCNISVMAADSNQARQNLIAVCNLLGLHNNQYDLNYYLKDFR